MGTLNKSSSDLISKSEINDIIIANSTEFIAFVDVKREVETNNKSLQDDVIFFIR